MAGKSRKYYKVLLIFTLFMLGPYMAFCQKKSPGQTEGYKTRMERFKVKKKDFKNKRYLAVGGAFNFLTYFGDLAPAESFLSTDINQIKPGISALIDYHYAPRMSLKAELLYGRLTGDDNTSANPDDPGSKSRYIRNLSFRNDIIDLSTTLQIYLFKNYLDFRQRKFFNIYLNGGVSIFYHNPKGKVPDYKISGERYPNTGKWVALRPLGTEGQFSEYYDRSPYSHIQFSVPFGGGFDFKLSDQLDLTFEINYRLLLTDYIDDVSGTYVDLGALKGDLAKSMSDRSQEEFGIITGEKRDVSNIETATYVSKYDGNRYIVFKGYGQESSSARRGGRSNDTYLLTGFKITYIINKAKTSEP